VFYFLRPSTFEVVCSFNVRKGHSNYYCDPFSPNNQADPSAGVLSEPVRSVTALNQIEKEFYESTIFNREFAPMYKNFTGGSEWLGKFPTEQPKHHIWRGDYFGQEHTVQSKETHFLELPPESLLRSLTLDDMKRANASTTTPLVDYRISEDIMNFSLTVVSVAPRILQIDNFLSDVEVDHVLDLAGKKNLQRSTTGMGSSDSHVSTTRTSSTTWLPRHSSPILDAIIRRAADVLKIDEALMRGRSKDERPDVPFHGAINEDIQIVHYRQGQEYTAHHDFGYPGTTPNSPSRSINLCMYLNEGMVGGETAFPRHRNAETDDGLKVVPKRGKVCKGNTKKCAAFAIELAHLFLFVIV
jgi:prolyl 4-hydroxylase